MSFKETVAKHKVAIAGALGAAAAAVPTLAFAEGETSNAATSAITSMASTVATQGQDMFVAVTPVIAPLVATGLIIGIGITFVRKLTNKSK